MRKLDFPCLDCGPITWLLTVVGYVCPTCQGDADDSDPTEECRMCHGHVWKPEPFNIHTSIIGPGSTAGRCWMCGGKGRSIKTSVRVAEFRAKLSKKQLEALDKTGREFRKAIDDSR